MDWVFPRTKNLLARFTNLQQRGDTQEHSRYWDILLIQSLSTSLCQFLNHLLRSLVNHLLHASLDNVLTQLVESFMNHPIQLFVENPILRIESGLSKLCCLAIRMQEKPRCSTGVASIRITGIVLAQRDLLWRGELS
jgi:hypothetical protein